MDYYLSAHLVYVHDVDGTHITYGATFYCIRAYFRPFLVSYSICAFSVIIFLFLSAGSVSVVVFFLFVSLVQLEPFHIHDSRFCMWYPAFGWLSVRFNFIAMNLRRILFLLLPCDEIVR